jgi:hypothetical protein
MDTAQMSLAATYLQACQSVETECTNLKNQLTKAVDDVKKERPSGQVRDKLVAATKALDTAAKAALKEIGPILKMKDTDRQAMTMKDFNTKITKMESAIRAASDAAVTYFSALEAAKKPDNWKPSAPALRACENYQRQLMNAASVAKIAFNRLK